MKNKVLAIFKYPRPWNFDVINRFSKFYDTEYIHLNDHKDKNFSQIINEINKQIERKNIEIVIFDVDYFKFINFYFIERIKAKTKILITGDDFDQHEMHSITASACDFVLSTCPLSVLKYKEKGYEAYPINFEISNFKDEKNNKEIDVLFFGTMTPDREEFLNHIIKAGVNIKNLGHHSLVEGKYGVSNDELLKLISKSKIILNLSKTKTTSVLNLKSESAYKFYYQFKGRVILAGLKGAACVSEYSPGNELIFSNDELLTFSTKEECVKILKNLLENEELLEQYTKKFTLKVHELWDDKKSFEPIKKAIEKLEHKRVELIKFPYWYRRIAAKQMIVRNLKISTIPKAIFQFSIIFSIVKNSDFLTKFLILFESIGNILWYSFILSFKSKK